MIRRGLSNVVSAAVIIFLSTLFLTTILYYLDSKSKEIETIGRYINEEIIRESESLEVHYSNGVLEILNNGQRDVVVKGVFVETDEGVEYINISRKIVKGDSIEYPLTNFSGAKKVYVVTDRGRVFTPVSIPIQNTNNLINIDSSNREITLRIYDPSTSANGHYIPSRILYINYSDPVYYEIDLDSMNIIYSGGYPIYVSKDGSVIFTEYAVYYNYTRLFYSRNKLDLLYIGYNYIIFKSYNGSVYMVSNSSIKFINIDGFFGVSSDYIYNISYVGEYDGKYLYKINVLNESLNNVKTCYLLLDFNVTSLTIIISQDGELKRVVGWFRPYAALNSSLHQDEFSFPIKVIGYYGDGLPIYGRDGGILISILNNDDSDLTNFKIIGPIWGKTIKKLIWGMVSKVSQIYYRGDDHTTLEYIDVFKRRDYLSQLIYFRSGYYKNGNYFDGIISKFSLKYIFQPSGYYLEFNVSFIYSYVTYPNYYIYFTQTIKVSFYDGVKITELYSLTESTGYKDKYDIKALSGGFMIPLEVGIDGDRFIISFNIYKTLNYTSYYYQGPLNGFIIYKPSLIYHRKIVIEEPISSFIIKIYNYTEYAPVNPNDIHDNYVALSILAVSKGVMNVVSKDLYSYELINYTSINRYLPNYLVLINGNDKIRFLGWSYVVTYSFKSLDDSGLLVYDLITREVKDFYENLYSVGIWFIRIDNKTPYLSNLTPQIASYDAIFIVAPKYIIVEESNGFSIVYKIRDLVIQGQ